MGYMTQAKRIVSAQPCDTHHELVNKDVVSEYD